MTSWRDLLAALGGLLVMFAMVWAFLTLFGVIR